MEASLMQNYGSHTHLQKIKARLLLPDAGLRKRNVWSCRAFPG
jgi:hypothetical protein